MNQLRFSRIDLRRREPCLVAERLPHAEQTLLVVVDGVIELVALGGKEDVFVVTRLDAGDLQDLSTLVGMNGLAIRTDTAASFLVFDRDTFYRLAALSAATARWAMERLGVGRAREQRREHELALMVRETAVMAEMRRIAVLTTLSAETVLVARTTLREIAQRIRCRREEVSRALASLKRSGQIHCFSYGLYLIPVPSAA